MKFCAVTCAGGIYVHNHDTQTLIIVTRKVFCLRIWYMCLLTGNHIFWRIRRHEKSICWYYVWVWVVWRNIESRGRREGDLVKALQIFPRSRLPPLLLHCTLLHCTTNTNANTNKNTNMYKTRPRTTVRNSDVQVCIVWEYNFDTLEQSCFQKYATC